MEPNIIYSNPELSDPAFLFGMINKVRRCGNRWTLIEYRVDGRKVGSKFLYSRLAHTSATEKMWSNCRATFLFENYDVHTVVGTWGKLYLVPSDHFSLAYSTVQYVSQTERDRTKSLDLEERTRNAPRQAAEEQHQKSATRIVKHRETVPPLF